MANAPVSGLGRRVLYRCGCVAAAMGPVPPECPDHEVGWLSITLVTEALEPIEQRFHVDGERVAQARRAIGMSRRDLADAMRWSLCYVSRIETGAVDTLREDVIRRLLQLLPGLRDA